MKKIFTHFNQTIFLLLFFVSSLYAQDYRASIIGTNGPFSALAKDSEGNIFAIKAISPSEAAVVKYTKGDKTEEVIYDKLTRDGITYPWGLAVSASGDIYVSTSFDQDVNKVIKLTKTSNDYTSTDFLTGDNYFTGLTISNNNLYALQYNADNESDNKYEIVRYNNLESTESDVIYSGILSGVNLSYPTSLAVSSTGVVYYSEPISVDGSNTYTGGVSKVVSTTQKEVISSANYTTALTFDANDNLFALEGEGSNSDYSIYKYEKGLGEGKLLAVEGEETAKSSLFIYPWGVLVDNEEIFYLDGDNGVDGGKLVKLGLIPKVVNVTSEKENGTYKIGDIIPITITFDRGVVVTGQPTLELATGDVNRKAIYVENDENKILFNYTVQIGDTSADLDYISSSALSVNGGKITSYTDVDAILTLPDPGEEGSLGANKALVVNTSDTTVWDGVSWSNGTPDLGKSVILRANFDGDITSRSITFETDITVKEGTLYIVDQFIKNDSHKVVFENGAYLVQYNNENNNVGIFEFKRQSNPIYKGNVVDWSSPVSNQNIIQFPVPTISAKFSRFSELMNTWNENITPLNEFRPAEVISMTAQNGFNEFGQGPALAFEGTFKGKPFNGDYEVMLTKSNLGYNSVGNPYPSLLDLYELLRQNNGLVSSAFVWNVNNQSINGENISGNWNAFNLNLGFSNPSINMDAIDFGQGFIVKAESSNLLKFNNSMRLAYLEPKIQDDKYWLTLESDSKVISSTLIGYKTGSTPQFENDFDTEPFKSDYGIYSVLNNQLMAIQGRGEVFDIGDRFRIAVETPSLGNYTINFTPASGSLFESGQSVYLIDHEKETSVDLSKQSYNFIAEKGLFSGRFEIVYDDESLNTKDLNKLNDVVVYNEGNTIVVKSAKDKLKSIQLYNLQGQQIGNISAINSLQKTITTSVNRQVLVVQIELVNGEKISKKVLIKN